jgi:3-methyladenine DNA glycosylase AlkD
LWQSGAHEARLLASMIADPKQVSRAQAEAWAGDFGSWDLCDQCCINLFRKTAFAPALIEDWRTHEAEFVKRAAFALIATLAVHDKQAADEVFISYLPALAEAADDERNFVKKAVNWALRQIGKRNRALNAAAIETAERIAARDSKAARWIAKDALRELTGEAAQKRLKG